MPTAVQKVPVRQNILGTKSSPGNKAALFIQRAVTFITISFAASTVS
jgi:hypothetical protein